MKPVSNRATMNKASSRAAPDLLTTLLRLARIVGAMTHDTVWHDQAFEVVADLERLALTLASRPATRGAKKRRAVDLPEFNALLRASGYPSQKAFAADIGLDGPKLTNLLRGKRRVQISEVEAMSRALNTAVPAVLRCFGVDAP
jgi:hypothetical protein